MQCGWESTPDVQGYCVSEDHADIDEHPIGWYEGSTRVPADV